MKMFRLTLAMCLLAMRLQAATVNKPAPAFSVSNSQGKTRTLEHYKGKVVLINFWASWCAPCQMELPELNRLAADYRGKDVRVLAINVDQEQFKAGTLLTKLGLESPDMEILWDAESKVVSAFDAGTMPTSYLLDSSGTVRFIHSGYHAHDPEKWRQEINRFLKS